MTSTSINLSCEDLGPLIEAECALGSLHVPELAGCTVYLSRILILKQGFRPVRFFSMIKCYMHVGEMRNTRG